MIRPRLSFIIFPKPFVQQMVGWKTGTERNLNPFGNAASEAAPRQDLAHKLGWPKEALL